MRTSMTSRNRCRAGPDFQLVTPQQCFITGHTIDQLRQGCQLVRDARQFAAVVQGDVFGLAVARDIEGHRGLVGSHVLAAVGFAGVAALEVEVVHGMDGAHDPVEAGRLHVQLHGAACPGDGKADVGRGAIAVDRDDVVGAGAPEAFVLLHRHVGDRRVGGGGSGVDPHRRQYEQEAGEREAFHGRGASCTEHGPDSTHRARGRTGSSPGSTLGRGGLKPLRGQ